MSHRSKAFQEIYDNAEADLRKLMGIPDNYKVLFIQGGATLQFSMIPMNLMKNGVADYIVTGAWSKKAFTEAKKYGDVQCIASSAFPAPAYSFASSYGIMDAFQWEKHSRSSGTSMRSASYICVRIVIRSSGGRSHGGGGGRF